MVFYSIQYTKTPLIFFKKYPPNQNEHSNFFYHVSFHFKFISVSWYTPPLSQPKTKNGFLHSEPSSDLSVIIVNHVLYFTTNPINQIISNFICLICTKVFHSINIMHKVQQRVQQCSYSNHWEVQQCSISNQREVKS